MPEIEQHHFVTSIGKHISFVDKFVFEADARRYFGECTRSSTILFASLHINNKLAEVFTAPAMRDRVVESTTGD